jgi:hypothetical protein
MKKVQIAILIGIFGILVLVPSMAGADGSKAKEVIGACTTQESLAMEATVGIVKDMAAAMQNQGLVRRCDQLLDMLAEMDKLQNQINATKTQMDVMLREHKREIIQGMP